METPTFVYIIYSDTFQEFYKGVTAYPQIRLREHNESKSRFTAGKGPWRLVYLKPYHTKREALIEEKRIKKLNRQSLLKLIGDNQIFSQNT
ncbi:MAG: GIY-YIG nuclease family protein [Bacteroidia bacterium]|jgi:putative endonuclease|nr:GIY-YIG nuclease family protein [Bacteroidia bacterium]